MNFRYFALPAALFVLAACSSGTISSSVTPPAPAVPAVVATYAQPAGNPYVVAMTAGPDGNIWMTETTNNIARMTPGGVFTEFPIPTAPNEINGITSGPDGNLWFTEGVGKVARITPTRVITEFSAGVAEQPNGITPGPDGRLWFSDYTPGKVGAITTAGAVTLFQLPPTSSFPTGITKGSDGNVWVCARGGNRIDRVTPSGVITEFPIPGAEGCDSMVLGPDGNVYFAPNWGGGVNATHIGRITMGGTFSFIQTGAPPASAAPAPGPSSVTIGKDGLIYFTIALSAKPLGRTTIAGTESEFSLSGSDACAVTAGSDGFLYDFDCTNHKMVKISY